jgi:hypothetical protein
MALALVSLVAGVENTNAQTPAIVGKVIVNLTKANDFNVKYLTQEQYQALMSRTNTKWERDENLGIPVKYSNNELRLYELYSGSARRIAYTDKVQDLIFTTNGLLIKENTDYYLAPAGYVDKKKIPGAFLYIDFNELSVNRAMSAAPIGTLKVTPSNNASEQTKVQWNVE